MPTPEEVIAGEKKRRSNIKTSPSARKKAKKKKKRSAIADMVAGGLEVALGIAGGRKKKR